MKSGPGFHLLPTGEPRSAEEAEAILKQMGSSVSFDVAETRSASMTRNAARPKPIAAATDEGAGSLAQPPSLSEQTFRTLVELAPDALVVIDVEGHIVLVNAGTEQLFGYRREELLGQPVHLLVPDKYKDIHSAHLDNFWAHPTARPMAAGIELQGRRQDGRTVPVEISLTPIKTERGLLATATVRDISDRKRLEARYRTLVEGIPAVTFMAALDEGNSEFYVSPQIEELLGFSQEEWLGDPFLWYRQLHPDDRERWGAEFARTCSAGVNFRSEYRFLSREGKEVWVHGEARVVRDEQGRPLFLQGIAFDITETKRAEAALRRSAEELEIKVRERTSDLEEAMIRAELASRARASFLANMSHEIRTPLNGIIGFADLLRRGGAQTDAERVEWLAIIHSSGKHLLALINDILDLSKIDAGKMSVELLPSSPTQIVQETCAILRSKAEEKGLRLEAIFEGRLPQTIRTDPTRFRQVLMNIAGNAIKFTPTGYVRIVARLDRPSDSPPMLVVKISDSGIGIAAEKLGTIFDPFTQADSSITRQFGGTGLGLAISKRLAEQLGGGVAVESELGRGTTFTCRIETGPLEGIPLVEHSAPTAKPAEPVPVKAAPPKLSHRILVVDDGDTNRKLVKLVLGRAGATVEQAENGRQGVDRALAEPFDVILMDMQMPVLDGYAATRELREHGLDVPIIAMTANAMKGDDLKCREAGCTGYLAKPIDHDLLIAAIAAIEPAAGRGPSSGSAKNVDSAGAPTTMRPASSPPDHPASGFPRSPVPPRGSTGGKLVSTLTSEDEEFREIIEQFAGRLRQKIAAMQSARSAGDCRELAALGHWLKGTSGSVGFRQFVDCAQELEERAQSGRLDEIDELIAELENMADRIALE